MSQRSGVASETLLRVRYAETDAMGIVHHSTFIIWFEAARSDWLRQRGRSYASVEADGFLLVVTEVNARFLAPAHYDEEVAVRTHLAELKSRKLRFEYEVVRPSDSVRLATGFSEHIVTDRSGRVITFPPEVRKLLEDKLIETHTT